MIHFDKKTLEAWEQDGIDTISVYFYQSGCAGTKIQVETKSVADCDTKNEQDGLTILLKSSEKDLIDGGRITHAGNKWIFQSSSINTRCGCGSSFSIKSNSPLLDKVARMKLAIKQKQEGVHK